ncbi:MAG: hypothetical protein QMD44_02375, partial [Thermodesulfovibrionales bacterium]|nr:hypothetical protein [Thermodesulfovibrionales bacterium]
MLRKTLIITDVTAMSEDNVCIAGYDSSLKCVRPVLPMSQIKKTHLFEDKELIIYPGAKVSFYFIKHMPHPPHVEDYVFKEDSIRFEGKVSEIKWNELLENTAVHSFADLFPKLESRYVPSASPGPSIGTFLSAKVPFLSCDYYKTPPRPRLKISDDTGMVIDRVAITDLAFRCFFEFLMKEHRGNCENVIAKINNKLQKRQVFLRLGLARP